MQRIKFDFEATKQIIDVAPDASVRIGAPVNANGVLANDGTAIGVVLDAQGVGVHRQLVVMVAGYCDIIDAQAIWGDEYSAEAMAAMSDIVFCDDHKIGGGGGWPADLPKPSVGGYGYTEQGEQTVITWDGDTEGKSKHPASPLYNISNNYISKDSLVGAKILFNDGTEYTISENDVDVSTEDGITLNTISGSFFGTEQISVVMTVSDDYGSVLPKGTYFVKKTLPVGERYVTSLTYSTPDTVHKIDGKYISGGGAMEVKFTAVDDVLTCNHTYGEIAAAFPNIIVTAERGSGRAVFPEMFISDEFFGATSIEVDGIHGEIDSILSTLYAISSDGVVTTYESEKFF